MTRGLSVHFANESPDDNSDVSFCIEFNITRYSHSQLDCDDEDLVIAIQLERLGTVCYNDSILSVSSLKKLKKSNLCNNMRKNVHITGCRSPNILLLHWNKQYFWEWYHQEMDAIFSMRTFMFICFECPTSSCVGMNERRTLSVQSITRLWLASIDTCLQKQNICRLVERRTYTKVLCETSFPPFPPQFGD